MTLTLFVLHWSPPQMKLCITLLVNAATECVAGLENLFATDPGTDPKSYPAYGQFIPEHEMKAFMYALPYLWADKKDWYSDQRTRPWEFIMPFIEAINSKRHNLLWVVFLVEDA